jgi:methanogen homocitrate synthase
MQGLALSPHNKAALGALPLPDEVVLYDSTLRDGEQMPGVVFSLEQKTEIAALLSEAGVRQIEAGFPTVSQKEKEAVRRIASLGTGSEILALARTCKKDIDAAMDCDVDMVMLFTASSDLLLAHKLRVTREELKDKVVGALEYAREHGLRYSFSTEDSTRTESDFLLELSRLAELHGACRIGLADTTGCALPGAVASLVAGLAKRLNVPISVHLHNDFGLALANALAGVEAGATAVATTVNGIGERAGNVPLEQMVMALEGLYGVRTGIDTARLTELSRRVSEMSGVPVSRNSPWVGENVFRHESGIHVASVLANPLTYECVPPEVVGGKRELVLGKHSGAVAVRHRLDSLGLRASDRDLERIVAVVKDSARPGVGVPDDLLRKIYESERESEE